MEKINFTKMVASGNDFILVERISNGAKLKNLARAMCENKFGVGADGLLVLEKSRIADLRMRIFNADGSEAAMCGNGARCVALWAKSKILNIETKAGIIESQVKSDNVRIKLTDPKDIKMNISIKVNSRPLKVNFINTGVPHTVIFVEGLDRIEVASLGRQIRYHNSFKPAGTNVDFVEILDYHSIKIRTYERGVEDETLACGTGSVASAVITIGRLTYWKAGQYRVNVHTRSGEILKVYFDNEDNKIKNVWLEGEARIVYKGEYYV